jgi:hypothetical protein
MYVVSIAMIAWAVHIGILKLQRKMILQANIRIVIKSF